LYYLILALDVNSSLFSLKTPLDKAHFITYNINYKDTMSLKFLSNIIVSFILVCLLASQLPALPVPVSASNVNSTYSISNGLSLKGVKTDKYHLSFNEIIAFKTVIEEPKQEKSSPIVKYVEMVKEPFVNKPIVNIPSASPTTAPTKAPGSDWKPFVMADGNLVANFSFENSDNGWARHWEKDGDGFTLDINSQGNDDKNSIHFVSAGSDKDQYLFSQRIRMDSKYSYTWSQYINMPSAGADLNFYIDEYDVNGNWISGYKMGNITTSPFVGIKTIYYTPTTAHVSYVRLQYSVTGAQIPTEFYLDSIYFSK
jgi:hypothetical protein